MDLNSQAMWKFQSTHPRRVWQTNTQTTKSKNRFQSTHPRRVWRLLPVLGLISPCFNPHTHAGCDLMDKTTNSIHTKFQSTHPRRVWLQVCPAPLFFVLCFNPHTHAGCDVFICSDYTICQSFNPHTHAGCDVWENTFSQADIVSIHTPTQGVTVANMPSGNIWLPFQSTHPRRVWPAFRQILRILLCFNPHTHAGCD